MKVGVIIEKGLDGTYDAYLEESHKLSFGLLGHGNTVEETIEDFNGGCDDMKELYNDLGKDFPNNIEFEFRYDVASFLSYYSRKLSLAGLQAITGINQGQLSHYVNGRKKPTMKTIKKIESSIHNFGSELSQIKFI